jgi:transposase-like protein
MVRNSLKYVSWKDYKAVTADLKRVYRSATEDEALLELERFAETWDGQYPQIAKSWRTWTVMLTCFLFFKIAQSNFLALFIKQCSLAKLWLFCSFSF